MTRERYEGMPGAPEGKPRSSLRSSFAAELGEACARDVPPTPGFIPRLGSGGKAEGGTGSGSPLGPERR